MNFEIINQPRSIKLLGHSGIAYPMDIGKSGFAIMGDLWDQIKKSGIVHSGRNIWVYEADNKMFTGVEITEMPDSPVSMEYKLISLEKYAYYKHTGNYTLLKQVWPSLHKELEKQGYRVDFPGLEIYGHWTEEESKWKRRFYGV